MKIRGILRIVIDLISKNIVVSVLLFLMCFISAYMIDGCFSDYFANKKIVESFYEPFNVDYNQVYYVGYQDYGELSADASAKISELIPQFDNVEISGRFTGSRIYDKKNHTMINAVVVEDGILELGKLGLNREQIDLLREYKGDYEPVMVGNYIGANMPVGTTFSETGDGEDEYIVVGILDEGALWPLKGRIGTYMNSIDICMDEQILICPKNYSEFCNSGKEPEEIYFVCTEECCDEVTNKIVDEATKCNATITIRSIGEMVSDKIQEYGFDGNKEFIASILMMILSLLSMSSAAIVVCMSRSYDFGVMWTLGISMKEIGIIIVIENMIITISAGALSYIVRQIQINKMYANQTVAETVASAWKWSHGIVVPVILVMCMLVMIMFASVFPINMLRREEPVNLIRCKE